jgi:hypothetical protein
MNLEGVSASPLKRVLGISSSSNSEPRHSEIKPIDFLAYCWLCVSLFLLCLTIVKSSGRFKMAYRGLSNGFHPLTLTLPRLELKTPSQSGIK